MQVPKIRIENQPTEEQKGPKEGSILDYMGIPTHLNENGMERDVEINALPIRAYTKIWNEFFRDQNVGNAAAVLETDEIEAYEDHGEEATEEQILKEARKGGRCLPVSRYHDYFSSCMPYAQRGPEVTIALTGNAPVKMYDDKGINGTTNPTTIWMSGSAAYLAQNNANETVVALGSTEQSGGESVARYIATDLSNIEAATINQLRQAFAVQHYYEALARGGSRYREQVRALFGVSISDKTVQVPEYLGGGRYHVNINQIVQTSGQQTENDTPIGETGAMSITPINESSFTKSFEEHGFVIGVMCVRHNHSYQQGLERFWSRSDRLDYYFPQFANLGEQPVKKKEIMLSGTAKDDETFGYQEAWADYRMKPNRVSGKMRSNAEGTLDFWHYADNYKTVPTLSQEWMNEGKTEIARTLIVQNEPQFFGAIRVMNKTTRCMPLYSVPGLEKL